MRFTAFLAVLTLGTLSANAADPGLLALAMPDAKVLAGANITALKISPFGTYVLSQIPVGDKGLAELIAATGFDPRNDLTEVLMASTGAAGATPKQNGIALARGTFDVEKITAAVNAKGGQGVDVSTYDGATLISHSGDKGSGSIAFLNGTIVIAGPTDLVKAALDRTKTPTSIDPALAAKVAQVSGSEDVWMVSVIPASQVLANKNVSGNNKLAAGAMNILQNIEGMNGGVKFGSNVDMSIQAVTNDPKNAQALGAMLTLIETMVASAAPSNAAGQQGVEILKSLQVKTEGVNVDVSLSVPESQFETLMKEGAAKKATAKQKAKSGDME